MFQLLRCAVREKAGVRPCCAPYRAFRRPPSVGQVDGLALLQYLVEYLAGLPFFSWSVCSECGFAIGQTPGVYISLRHMVPCLPSAAASPARGSRSGLPDPRLRQRDGCRPCCMAVMGSVASSAIMAVRAAGSLQKFRGTQGISLGYLVRARLRWCPVGTSCFAVVWYLCSHGLWR